MINRETFFATVRAAPFGGSMSQSQVDGMNQILDEWERRGLSDLRHCSYMLASVYHETAHTIQPIKEMGSEAYLRSKPYYPFYGRGLIQVTWSHAYKKFGCYHEPDAMLGWAMALHALFDGMIGGMFTTKKLSDYFNDTRNDPVSARQIVNGMDRATMIAGYHGSFLTALQAASDGKVVPVPITPPPPPPPTWWDRFKATLAKI